MAIQTNTPPCTIHGHFKSGFKERSVNSTLVIRNSMELDDLARKAGIKGEPLLHIQAIDLSSRDVVLIYDGQHEELDCMGITQMISTANQVKIFLKAFYFYGAMKGTPMHAGWIIVSKPKDHKEVIVDNEDIYGDALQEPEFKEIKNPEELARMASRGSFSFGENRASMVRDWVEKKAEMAKQEWSEDPFFKDAPLDVQKKLEAYIEFMRIRKENYRRGWDQFQVLRNRVAGPSLGSAI
jgi:hypothetical protein